jgi:hypothetical protein
MSKRTNHPISHKEAEEAIFLDFEGCGKQQQSDPDPPPVIAGVLRETKYNWTLLDPLFSDAAEHHGADILSIPEFLKSLIDSGRRIVYWTSHEEDIFKEHGFPLEEQGFDLKIPVRPHFKELFEASRQARKTYYDLSGAKKKKAVQLAFGLCVQCAERHGPKCPTTYGKGEIGNWIRLASEFGAERNSYKEWRRSAKNRWTRLISHNRTDCRAMELLMKHYGITDQAPTT